MATLRADAGGCVAAFPSEQWTLEYDLAHQAELAVLVYQAVMLAKRPAGRTTQQIKDDAAAQVTTWRGEVGNTAETVAVHIYEPMHRKNVSKAEVAEQLAKLIEESPDNAATFRAKLPANLVAALEYVTSPLPPAAEAAAAVAGASA